MKATKPATSQTSVASGPEGLIKITHSQSVRQSADYQSVECNYGVEFYVKNTPYETQRGIERAEEIVEQHMTAKLSTHRQFLKKIGGTRG